MKTRTLRSCISIFSALLALQGHAAISEPVADKAAIPDGHLTAPLPMPASGEIRVAFLISADAEVVDFGGPWGVFEYAAVGPHRHNPFRLYTVAATKDPITVSGGLTVVPNYTFNDAPAPNVVIVPALDIEKLAPAAEAWLRSVHRQTDVTMSVCDGAFVLAKAGLLDGKTATAHHAGYAALGADFPAVKVVRGVRYVEDGKVATSGGLTSGTDLALRVVERYLGRDAAKQTATNLEYLGTGWMHPESNGQFALRVVATAEKPVCPVCEMELDGKTDLTATYDGTTYYFCQKSCHDQFVAAPDRFVDRKKAN